MKKKHKKQEFWIIEHQVSRGKFKGILNYRLFASKSFANSMFVRGDKIIHVREV